MNENDDINDNDDMNDDEYSEETAINLKYVIFQDETEKSVYIKFEGFSTNEQLEEFEQFIESYMPLIFSSEKTAH